jgi:hypothetical protein
MKSLFKTDTVAACVQEFQKTADRLHTIADAARTKIAGNIARIGELQTENATLSGEVSSALNVAAKIESLIS